MYKTVGSHDLWKVQAVKDLVDAKFNHNILPNFTTNEIDDMRDDLSTCKELTVNKLEMFSNKHSYNSYIILTLMEEVFAGI